MSPRAHMRPPSAALREVMAASVPLLRDHCRDPWVVVCSAACALAGADGEVADLDRVASHADAARPIAVWPSRQDGACQPADAGRFRTRLAPFLCPGMPLEVMGGHPWHGAGGWQCVQVTEVVHVPAADIAVPISSRSEQIGIPENLGRPKDMTRAKSLRAL